jgi:hypothetical protein
MNKLMMYVLLALGFEIHFIVSADESFITNKHIFIYS